MGLRTAIGTMVAFVLVVGAVILLWWDIDVRWRPHDLTKDQGKIAALLQAAGWVSPGGGASKLYVVGVRDCLGCERIQRSDFPALQKAGVDTRVIMIAAPDVNGKPVTTPAERAMVAELWVNRSWPLYQAWMAANPASWAAPGVPPADGDAARSAVVETSRDLADKLKPLLGENGVAVTWPLVIWQAKDGTLEAASGDAPKTWAYMKRDLGAP
ncbi:MAG TPA: hypothetical protein VN805_04625 [Caulobacteraceae bacterium]|nr:hypothetical protein [Caulobacteraceae bacterium]